MIRSPRQTAELDLPEAKRAFYRQPAVAAEYDARRWGGASGAYVSCREQAIIASLLPGRVAVSADLGTGTGRVLPELRRRSRLVVGVDTSLPMLRLAARNPGAQLVQGDAFAVPLKDAACETVVALRVLFHFDHLEGLLREARRITAPGGTLVCDTATWSPRSRLPLDRGHWGERVAAVSRERFRCLAASAGWLVVAERPLFLVSPYLYRIAPLPMARMLERLEPRFPRLLSRVFWALRAVPSDGAAGRAAEIRFAGLFTDC